MAISYDGPPPASAAWQEGDNPGRRQFRDLPSLTLEAGGALPGVRVAYETFGRPRRDSEGRISNAVLVLHALTGDAHVAGPDGPGQLTAGWWDDIVGSGKALDTDEWFVVSPNVLGGCQGTTGPSSLAPDGKPWGSRWPRLTIRDQVRVEIALADLLGIEKFVSVIGGSMGGMRALEWAVMAPNRVDSALVLAVGAASTADEIGLYSAQVLAIRTDPRFRDGDYYSAQPGDGPHNGLGLARRMAHMTYRSDTELELRFGRTPQGAEDPLRGGRYAIESYLDHHSEKLVRRFDAGTYVSLTEAMNTHDVGRGRGGVAKALESIRVPVVVGGIDTDRLYPIRLQEELAAYIPTADPATIIGSPYGHDGFLIEAGPVGELVQSTLDRSREFSLRS